MGTNIQVWKKARPLWCRLTGRPEQEKKKTTESSKCDGDVETWHTHGDQRHCQMPLLHHAQNKVTAVTEMDWQKKGLH